MKLPNGQFALIPEEKLLQYVLNENHPTNAGHAELFRRLLAIEAENVGVLRDALVAAARDGEAELGKPSIYGQKYAIRFEMTGARGVYIILSVWMIERGTDIPRLVTTYVE